ERLAVGPLDVAGEVKRQRLVAVAPLPRPREPGHGLESALAGDDERLVERALDKRAARQPGGGVRIEVLRKGGIARPRHDEAAVRCCASADPVDRRGRSDGEDRRERRAGGHCSERRESTGGAGTTSHRLSFLAQPAGRLLRRSVMAENVSGTVYHDFRL